MTTDFIHKWTTHGLHTTITHGPVQTNVCKRENKHVQQRRHAHIESLPFVMSAGSSPSSPSLPPPSQSISQPSEPLPLPPPPSEAPSSPMQHTSPPTAHPPPTNPPQPSHPPPPAPPPQSAVMPSQPPAPASPPGPKQPSSSLHRSSPPPQLPSPSVQPDTHPSPAIPSSPYHEPPPPPPVPSRCTAASEAYLTAPPIINSTSFYVMLHVSGWSGDYCTTCGCSLTSQARINNASTAGGSSAGRRLSSDSSVISALDLQLLSDSTGAAPTGLDAAWRVSTPRDGSYSFSLSAGSVNVTQHVMVGAVWKGGDIRATSVSRGLVVNLVPK